MFEVRRAEPGDEAGICRVCTAGWRDTYDDRHPEEYVDEVVDEYYTEERVAREIENPEGWDGWHVAVENEGIIGAAGGGLTDAETGEVYVLYVDPAAQRQGAGTSLLNAVTEEQVEAGATEQWVSVVDGNGVGTDFYRQHGFTVEGRREEEGESVASLRLQRRIGEVDPEVPDPEAAGVDAPGSMIDEQDRESREVRETGEPREAFEASGDSSE
ncbi:GNAT family N-acetyltransferase [Halobium salinum]|uniref:GNAT family N-acetyltransferase n=1 Tax=Halobium salinum TaxID=1364940 RepID=A0ABD5PBA1_9EURY|nr:GNAT family N-acetyltransferase [Halobium salinum]